MSVSMAKILLVEDDAESSQMTKSWLTLDRHEVDCVDNGEEAIAKLRVYNYDVILLDWQLPEHSGVDILKEFRRRGGTSPVLLLTGRALSSDKEIGLDSGADDYLTKPFDGKELLARIRALLRRSSGFTDSVLKCRDIVLDPQAYRVTRNGKEIHLLPKEFALLDFLMRNPSRLFSQSSKSNRVIMGPQFPNRSAEHFPLLHFLESFGLRAAQHQLHCMRSQRDQADFIAERGSRIQKGEIIELLVTLKDRCGPYDRACKRQKSVGGRHLAGAWYGLPQRE